MLKSCFIFIYKNKNMIKDFNNFNIYESIQYHKNNNIPLTESIYRPNSKAYYKLLTEVRMMFDKGEIILDGLDLELYENTDIGK
jgi:hypothetical protein